MVGDAKLVQSMFLVVLPLYGVNRAGAVQRFWCMRSWMVKRMKRLL